MHYPVLLCSGGIYSCKCKGRLTWSGVVISAKTFLGEDDLSWLFPSASALRGDDTFLGEAAERSGLTPSALSGDDDPFLVGVLVTPFLVGVLVTLPRCRGSEVAVEVAVGGSEAVLFSLREFSLFRRLERRAGRSRSVCFIGAIVKPSDVAVSQPEVVRSLKLGHVWILYS